MMGLSEAMSETTGTLMCRRVYQRAPARIVVRYLCVRLFVPTTVKHVMEAISARDMLHWCERLWVRTIPRSQRHGMSQCHADTDKGRHDEAFSFPSPLSNLMSSVLRFPRRVLNL